MSSVESSGLGAWVPIKDINDPAVQEIGRIAVDWHNKENGENLKFKRVVNGQTRESSYNLVVEAENVNEINWTYETVVIVQFIGIRLPLRYIVTSFEAVLKNK